MPRPMLLALMLTACGGGSPAEAPPPPPAPARAAAPAPAPAAVDAAAKARAQETMQLLGSTLKGALMGSMKAGGPTAALDVCSQQAGSLTASVAATSGIAVGRSSLRLRNPSNAGPDWVTSWLEALGERPAEGVTPAVSTAKRADGTEVVRVVAPLAVEGPCVICHGPTDTRDPALQQALAASYPQDKASGYAVGDLRGAVWAEAPVVPHGLDLALDGGAKWSLDDSTRDSITAIRAALTEPPPADVAAAHALAARIDASLSTMIAECTMKGDSHDQLHHFLEGFFPGVSALKKSADLPAAMEARAKLRAQVVAFDATFE